MDGSRTEVIQMDVTKLYGFWQASQKNPLTQNRGAIENYKKSLSEGEKLKPIMIENYGFDDDGKMYIRTLNGRHRLVASYESNIGTIDVVKTSVAELAKDAFK